jgi:hypothetical protein
MAATLTDNDVLRKGEKVVAASSMPGIPEGTGGKVFMVSGFEWIRYWVRFENGQVRGSIHRHELCRVRDWPELQARRARGEDEPAAASTAGSADGDGDGSAPAAAGEGIMHAGVLVPAHLLERSKKRREALGLL